MYKPKQVLDWETPEWVALEEEIQSAWRDVRALQSRKVGALRWLETMFPP